MKDNREHVRHVELWARVCTDFDLMDKAAWEQRDVFVNSSDGANVTRKAA